MVLVLGLCNPLLDISAHVDPEVLERYHLKPNDAILAGPEHQSILQHLSTLGLPLLYSAGGAGQNAMRAAQWLLPPHSVAYMGAVGEDANADRLQKAAEKDGLLVCYQRVPGIPTGTCVCLLTGEHRSLVASLDAANCFSGEHLLANGRLVEGAEALYLSGFLLTVAPDALLAVARQAFRANKRVYLNMSAPFICSGFTERLLNLLPYVTCLFGNEAEARALAAVCSLPHGSAADTAAGLSRLALAADAPAGDGRGRMVVLTQGPQETVVVDQEAKLSVFPVPAMSREDIVDTNGAGDAFVGGFLSQHLRNRPLSVCVECGHAVAQLIIRQSGIVFPADLLPRQYL